MQFDRVEQRAEQRATRLGIGHGSLHQGLQFIVHAPPAGSGNTGRCGNSRPGKPCGGLDHQRHPLQPAMGPARAGSRPARMQRALDAQRNDVGIGAQRNHAGRAVDFHGAAGGGRPLLREHHHRSPLAHGAHQAFDDIAAAGGHRTIRNALRQCADPVCRQCLRQHDQWPARQEQGRQQRIEQRIAVSQHQRPAARQLAAVSGDRHPEQQAQQQFQYGAQHVLIRYPAMSG